MLSVRGFLLSFFSWPRLATRAACYGIECNGAPRKWLGRVLRIFGVLASLIRNANRDDSHCESILANRFAEKTLIYFFHNVRAIRANRLEPAICNVLVPRNGIYKNRGFSSGILKLRGPNWGLFFVLKFVRSRVLGARFLQPFPRSLVTVEYLSHTKMAVNSR